MEIYVPGFKKMQIKADKIRSAFVIFIALILLYFTTHYHYLLFHSLVEIFSIVIAITIFMIAWNSSEYSKNYYFIFLGIGYLFIGGLDLLHTLTYKGMNIITDYDYYANQLWIATRYLESLTLLIAFYFLNPKRNFNKNNVLLSFSFISILIILSIFIWKIFPICFIDGQGLTTFKKISEYIISIILVCDLILLSKFKSYFDPYIFKLLTWSILFTIGSELAFTFYISNYGLSNLVGHYFKLASFYLIYKAVVERSIKEPYRLVFRQLNQKNEELSKQQEQLKEYANMQEMLLKEVNHRVKNNLISLVGLFNLEEKSEKARNNASYRELINDFKTRIQGLLTVHQLLSANKWNPININELCNKIVEFVVQGGALENQYSITTNETDILINSNQAHQLSLVFNELAANTIKHFKKNEHELVIDVNITLSENKIVIVYQDNGPGYPQKMIDGDYSKTSTGFELIKGIVTHTLSGEMHISNDNGAKTEIKIPQK